MTSIRTIWCTALLGGTAVCSWGQEWNAAVRHLGALNEDGTLHEQIPLTEITIAEQVESIALTHILAVALDGSTRSDWAIPQLAAWLVPTGEGLALRLPGGGSTTFPAPLPAEGEMRPSRSEGEPTLRRLDRNTYEVLLVSGNTYTYTAGRLSELRTAGGVRFSFATTGGRITAIADAGGAILLRADQDQLGRIRSLTAGETRFRFEYSEETGRLTGITKAGATFCRLTYTAGLIARLEVTDAEARTYQWATNPQYDRNKIRRYIEPPVTLCASDEVRYFFENDVVHSRTVLRRMPKHAPNETMVIDWLTNASSTN